MVKENDFREQEGIAISVQFILFLFLISIGIFLVLNQGLVFDDLVFRAFLFYSITGAIFPLASLVNLLTGSKFFFFYVFRPQDSLIFFLWQSNKKDPTANFLWNITKNFILTFIFWQSLFIIPAFLGALFIPQSALPFFQRFIFPVRPQSIFNIDTNKFFFTIFPSPTETGALAFLVSITSSLIIRTYILVFKKKNIIPYIISLLVAGVLLSGFYWVNIHQFVSQGRQFDRTGHLVFGVESGVITILTGQWSPAVALHNANLLFWFLSDELSSREFLRVGLQVTAVLMFILILLFVLVQNNSKQRKKILKIFK